MPILEWYFEVERADTHISTTPVRQLPETTGIRAAEPRSPPRPDMPVKVVPQGLRSFDAHDADFFLELLPGPRAADGLPESLRFWKHRVEADDELSFTVGVLYGPSGCGKSSLLKAGLLPRLAAYVLPVHVEAARTAPRHGCCKGCASAVPACRPTWT